MLFEVNTRKINGKAMKITLTTSGKIFFAAIAFVVIIFVLTSVQPTNQQRTTYIYCVPDCVQQSVPIGTTTLVRGCFINQTECQIASSETSQAENNSEIFVGFADSFHKIPGVGTATMLDLNVTKVYIRENNQTDWITLFDGAKAFDIVGLDNQSAIIANATLPVKIYTQEKVVLGNGNVKIYSLTFGIYNKTYLLHSGVNETVTSYSFTPSPKTLLLFDLVVENSVQHTADGYFIYPQFNVSSLTILNDNQLSNSIFVS